MPEGEDSKGKEGGSGASPPTPEQAGKAAAEHSYVTNPELKLTAPTADKTLIKGDTIPEFKISDEVFKAFSNSKPWSFPTEVMLLREKRATCNDGGSHNMCIFTPYVKSVAALSFKHVEKSIHIQTMKAKSSGFSFGVGYAGFSLGVGFSKAKSTASLTEKGEAFLGYNVTNGTTMAWVKHCVNCEKDTPSFSEITGMVKILTDFAITQTLSEEDKLKLAKMGLEISQNKRENFIKMGVEAEYNKDWTHTEAGSKSRDEGSSSVKGRAHMEERTSSSATYSVGEEEKEILVEEMLNSIGGIRNQEEKNAYAAALVDEGYEIVETLLDILDDEEELKRLRGAIKAKPGHWVQIMKYLKNAKHK